MIRVLCILLSFLMMFGPGCGGKVMYEPAAPYLMLSAHMSNWGVSVPGQWSGKSWEIRSDGNYEMKVFYISGPEQTYEPTVYTGTLTAEELRQLCEACDCEWIDPKVKSDGCDGEAWTIEMYDPDGNVIHSSGEYGYIYGQKNLEAITRLLPHPELNRVLPKEATMKYFRTVTTSTTYEEMFMKLGPASYISGSGIIAYHWKMDDGSAATVTFFDNHVMTLVIARDGKVEEYIVW